MHDCHPKIIKPSQYHQSLSSVLKIILWQACWTSILLKYLIHLHFWSWGSKNWKWVSISPVFEWFRQIQFSRVGTPSGSRRLRLRPPTKTRLSHGADPAVSTYKRHFATGFLCKKHTGFLVRQKFLLSPTTRSKKPFCHNLAVLPHSAVWLVQSKVSDMNNNRPKKFSDTISREILNIRKFLAI